MNTRIAHIAFALLTSLAGHTWATSIDPAQVAVDITATPAAKAAAVAVLTELEGEYRYQMSNGRHMVVIKDGQTLIVQYGRRQLGQLQHDGQGRFVSSDGRFVLRFGLDDEGQPYAVSLSLPAALA